MRDIFTATRFAAFCAAGRHAAVARHVIVCVGLAFGLWASAGGWTAAADQRFVTGFEDLPLMPELAEIPDTGVAFDTTTGRIVIAFARASVSRERVANFYRMTLAQMGWAGHGEAGLGEMAFVRAGEVLNLDFSRDGDEVIVRFSLLPE